MALLADLISSLRTFRRAPALTSVLLLTIALGIGSNATVLGFIRGLVAREPPLPGIESIVSIFARDADAFGPVSFEEVLALQKHPESFESLGAVRESQSTVTIAGRLAVLSVASVTDGLAALLTLPTQDGIVISHRVWRDEFGASAGIPEAQITMDGVDHRIAGVAPEWLDGVYIGRAVDVWVPLRPESLRGSERTSRTFWVLGRLRAGTSAGSAQTSLNANRTGDRTMAVHPYTGVTPDVISGFSRLERLLPLAAGFVFFIACANVAAFLLSRASARSHETAVRVAIGASRRQLGRQLLADSLVISVAGAAAGALLASWTAGIIPALLFEQDAEHLVSAPDVIGIVQVSAICLAITVACGLVPLFELRDDDPVAVLRRESAGPSMAMRRLRTGLVVAQMACCCVLVITTGMLLEGFRAALRTGAGQRLGEPLLATVQAQSGVRPAEGLEYLRKVEDAALSVRGVTSAAWVGSLPGSRPLWQPVRVEPPGLASRDVVIDVAAFTPRTRGDDSVAAGGGPDVRRPRYAGKLPRGHRQRRGGERIVRWRRGRPVHRRSREAARRDRRRRGHAHTSGRLSISTDDLLLRRSDGAAPGPHGSADVPADRAANADADRCARHDDRVAGIFFDHGIACGRGCRAVRVAAIGLPHRRPQSRSRRALLRRSRRGRRDYRQRRTPDGDRRRRSLGAARHVTAAPRANPVSADGAGLSAADDARSWMPRKRSDMLVAAVRRALIGVPGGAVLPAVMTLDAHLSRTALAPQRIATLLVSASALLGLLLGGLGMYGALADSARRQRREIALRIALGAQSWRVVRQVVAEGIRLAGVGTLAGLLGALLAARGLTRISPGADAAAAWVWLAAPVVLLTAVCIASVLPARRALAVSPLTIMRDN